MIKLPSFNDAYEHENAFYLTSQPGRTGKLLAHYELYKSILLIHGAIVECGIFKGASFARFAAFRHLFESPASRKLIGFDIFGKFPETKNPADIPFLQKFIESAGDESISRDQLFDVLTRKQCGDNVELVEGDITITVPRYAKEHPQMRIALLNLDVDVLEPNIAILETFWPRMAHGGILILDDYGIFPGATQAVDEYFADMKMKIRKFPYVSSPTYIVNE